METDYYQKYLKYKAKYAELKKSLDGGRRGRSPSRSPMRRLSRSPMRRLSSPYRSISPTISPFNRPVNIVPIMGLPIVIRKEEKKTTTYEDNIIFTDGTNVIFIVPNGTATIDKPMELKENTSCNISFAKINDILSKRKLEVRISDDKIHRIYFANISNKLNDVETELSGTCEIKKIPYAQIKKFFDDTPKIENKEYEINSVKLSNLVIKSLFKASRKNKITRSISPLLWPHIVIAKESHEEDTGDNLLTNPTMTLKSSITNKPLKIEYSL